MILPIVSELLARVARRSVADEAFEALRQRGGEVRLAGLTDPAKALIIPLAFAELGRPFVILVETNQRAEMLLEPLRYFYRAITGKPDRRVVHLPAHEVLPYENRSPHAEISEDRAVALWSFATGEADLLIAPVQAALWRLRDREFYSQLARTISRDETIEHQDLINFLSSAGYDKQVTCDMPGQFAVRGGIIDIYSPESLQPVRVELLGDTIESIRAYDPTTQRSTSPIERTTLLPLTEFPRHAEILEKMRVHSASGREDDSAPAGFYPGWEFREALRETRNATLFDLANEPLIVEDEPSLLAASIEKYRAQLAEAFAEVEDPLAEPPEKFIFDDEEWNLARQMAPRFSLEHLALENPATEPATPGQPAINPPAELRVLQTQPTTRYHGNVPAFIAEARTRIAAGDQVMVSAASTGELERLADICHEFELPYRMGELEANATVTRLAQEESSAPGAGIVLTKAPLSEGVAFVDAKVVLYGNADLFETLPAPSQRARSRPKTSSFFSDFSDLKPGDYVVHVDHGIGQFEGLRQVAIEGANGETYEPGEHEAGDALRVLVTASVEHESVSRVSLATQPIAGATAPALERPPAISGTALAGQTLTTSGGEWSGEGSISYAYQWERCEGEGLCTAIEGATADSYTLTSEDVNHTVVALITATGGEGSSTGVSLPTAKVEPEDLAQFSAPSIAGVVQLGGTLSADPGIWSGAGAIAYAYQWERCSAEGTECAPITGADEAAYTVAGGDLSSALRVKVTASGPHGSETAFSAHTVGTPGGEVSVEEAQEVAQRTDSSILAPSTKATLEEQTIKPALEDGETEIHSESMEHRRGSSTLKGAW